jgi:CRP-like cAMP-binding protein
VSTAQSPHPAADPHRNVLLDLLPPAEFERLVDDLEWVSLPRGTDLEVPNQEIEHVYFPTSGIASIVALGENGESVDTTMVGREGMTGLAVFLGTGQMPIRTMVQLPLEGFRMRSDVLRAELERGGVLVALLHRYTQVVMVSMAQLILCNRAHRLDQRAARWLLQVDERVDEAPFEVTQEFLAEMIGTQRPSVSLAVRQFKDDGLISYTRGSDLHHRSRRPAWAVLLLHHGHAPRGAASEGYRREARDGAGITRRPAVLGRWPRRGSGLWCHRPSGHPSARLPAT